MRFAPLILILTIAGGCVSQPQPRVVRGASTLTVMDYDGAGGHGRRIHYDGHVISIVVTNDRVGQKDKTVWTKGLSPAERAFLAERIEKVPLASLKDEYRDPGMFDGLQIFFDIQQSGKPSRSITVANEYVEELATLCDGLNVLLPYKYRIHYREWKDEMDREAAEHPAG